MLEPIRRRDDGRFVITITHFGYAGRNRGVRAGDRFTYGGKVFMIVGGPDSVYSGRLHYIADAIERD